MTKNYVSPLVEAVTLHLEGAVLVGSDPDSATAGSLNYYESVRWDGIE
jgi:hypothetical protein